MSDSPSSSDRGRPRSTSVATGAGLLLLCGLTACNAGTTAAGSPGSGGSGSTSGASGLPNAGAAANLGGSSALNCMGGVAVAPAALRRMTHDEYDHAARALLGTQLVPGQDFP